MPIVTRQRLNAFMDSPEWTPEQESAIDDVLAGLESTLEAALFNAWITPRDAAEVAPILRSGLVATRQPVFRVTSLDGVVVDDTHPLPAAWKVSDHRLRAVQAVWFPSVLTPAADWGRSRMTGSTIGEVSVAYEGGWGADPALVLAILTKARNWARNWLENGLTVRDTDGQASAPLVEQWTPDELESLSRFRNLTAVRR